MVAGKGEEREQLRDSVRQIVVTRERTPRSPAWASAWRHTLFRYMDRIEDLNRDEPDTTSMAPSPAPPDPEALTESE